jgi:hypothetical protein
MIGMTAWDFINNLLSGNYPIANWAFTIAGVVIILLVLRKPLFKWLVNDKLGLVTKNEIKELKSNDFFHTNKAILIIAKETAPKSFERAKDCILETTPDDRKEEIRLI